MGGQCFLDNVTRGYPILDCIFINKIFWKFAWGVLCYTHFFPQPPFCAFMIFKVCWTCTTSRGRCWRGHRHSWSPRRTSCRGRGSSSSTWPGERSPALKDFGFSEFKKKRIYSNSARPSWSFVLNKFLELKKNEIFVIIWITYEETTPCVRRRKTQKCVFVCFLASWEIYRCQTVNVKNCWRNIFCSYIKSAFLDFSKLIQYIWVQLVT